MEPPPPAPVPPPAPSSGQRTRFLLAGGTLLAAYFFLGLEADGFIEPAAQRYAFLRLPTVLTSLRYPHLVTLTGWLWKTVLLLPAAVLLALFAAERFSFPAGWCSRWASSPRFPLFLSAAGLGAVLAVGSLVYSWAPLTDDETTYLFQAKLLSGGRLQADSPPASESFQTPFLIMEPHLTGKYSFGQPALIVPGLWAGFPPLVPVLMSAGLIWLTWRTGMLLRYGPGVSALAAILLTVSPFFLTVSPTLLSHPGAAFLLLLSLSLFLQYRVDGTHRVPVPLAGLVAGVAFGWAFNLRPLTAVAWAFPLGFLLLRELLQRRKAALPLVLSIVAGALVMLVLTLAHNQVITGDPLCFPFARYSPWERVGFPAINPEYTHTPLIGLNNLVVSLLRYHFFLLGAPVGFLLSGGILLSRRLPRSDQLLLGIAGIQGLVHVAWYTQGVMFSGPLYLYETLPLVMLLTARGFFLLNDMLERAFPARRGLLAWFLTVSIGLAGLTTFPERFLDLARTVEIEQRPFRQIREIGLTNAVVFIHSLPQVGWRFGYPPNRPEFDDPVLFCFLKKGPQNRKVLEAFPGREYYVLVTRDEQGLLFKPTVEQLTADAPLRIP